MTLFGMLLVATDEITQYIKGRTFIVKKKKGEHVHAFGSH